MPHQKITHQKIKGIRRISLKITWTLIVIISFWYLVNVYVNNNYSEEALKKMDKLQEYQLLDTESDDHLGGAELNFHHQVLGAEDIAGKNFLQKPGDYGDAIQKDVSQQNKNNQDIQLKDITLYNDEADINTTKDNDNGIYKIYDRNKTKGVAANNNLSLNNDKKRDAYMNSCGFVYVGVGKSYARETIQSAMSVRKRSKYRRHITFFTDDAGFEMLEFYDARNLFENIIHFKDLFNNSAYQAPRGTGTRKEKIFGMISTPYYKTVFLDSDTEICSNKIDEIFSLLNKFDVTAGHANSRQRGNQRAISAAFPELNTGIVGYRMTKETKAALYRWLHIWHGGLDQGPFRKAMWEGKQSLYTFPPEFNCRKAKTCGSRMLGGVTQNTYSYPCVVKHSHYVRPKTSKKSKQILRTNNEIRKSNVFSSHG